MANNSKDTHLNSGADKITHRAACLACGACSSLMRELPARRAHGSCRGLLNTWSNCLPLHLSTCSSHDGSNELSAVQIGSTYASFGR